MTTLDPMNWVVAMPSSIEFYTDHNNLTVLFDSLEIAPEMSQTSLKKLLRWDVRLSMCRYTLYHIKGEENIWADLLTRLAADLRIFCRLMSVAEFPSSSA